MRKSKRVLPETYAAKRALPHEWIQQGAPAWPLKGCMAACGGHGYLQLRCLEACRADTSWQQAGPSQVLFLRVGCGAYGAGRAARQWAQLLSAMPWLAGSLRVRLLPGQVLSHSLSNQTKLPAATPLLQRPRMMMMG